MIALWRNATTLPVDAQALQPGMSARDLARARLLVGNAHVEAGELFAFSSDGSDDLRVVGDVRRVARLGQGMQGGRLVIDGHVGPFLGAEMRGGRILAQRDTGSWAGCEMRGGEIEIGGSTGDFLGGAYPGSRLGMRDGTIVVRGAAGADVGLSMRRGLIAVRRFVGENAGRGMVAGTIYVGEGAGPGVGTGMKRGTILIAKPSGVGILPTFVRAVVDRPPFVAIYLRHLASRGFSVSPTGRWMRYNGDLACGGQGEVYLSADAPPESLGIHDWSKAH